MLQWCQDKKWNSSSILAKGIVSQLPPRCLLQRSIRSMGRLVTPIRFLSQVEMEAIHKTALQILDEVGMWIDSDEALHYLEDYGCKVAYDTRTVRFPSDLTQQTVDQMCQAYANPQRIPQRMSVRYSEIYFSTKAHRIHHEFTTNTGGFCVFIYDLEGHRRPATMEDVRACIRLADALDNVDFMGLPVSAQEVPHTMRPVIMAAELVKMTRKLGGVETFDRLDVEFITRIAEIAAGSPEELRRNPILVGYAEARSPLCLDRNMAEILVEYIMKGLPQSLDTMPNAGMTAPTTVAGCLALGVAESLGGLILGYAVDPDAILSIDVCPSKADMRTGLYAYASPERMPLLAANIQMINEFYGCPSGTHGGKTDACYPGVQVGMEKVMSMLFPIMAGSVGIGTMGHLENAVTFSPQQLVIDNEIAGSVRHMLKGFEVSRETLALDVIKEIGPGGSFLEHSHTLKHFREELFVSKMFDRLNWDAAINQPVRGIEERAKAVAAELMTKETQPPLTPEQERAIDEVVAEAWAKRRELGQV
jgi:trimethylamine--corrinoid protein Co-methyltransferase